MRVDKWLGEKCTLYTNNSSVDNVCCIFEDNYIFVENFNTSSQSYQSISWNCNVETIMLLHLRWIYVSHKLNCKKNLFDELSKRLTRVWFWHRISQITDYLQYLKFLVDPFFIITIIYILTWHCNKVTISICYINFKETIYA